MFLTGLHLVRSVGLRCLLLLGRKGILRRLANTGRGSVAEAFLMSGVNAGRNSDSNERAGFGIEALLMSRGPSSTANAQWWLLFSLFSWKRPTSWISDAGRGAMPCI